MHDSDSDGFGPEVPPSSIDSVVTAFEDECVGLDDTRSQDSLSFDRDGNIVLRGINPQVAKPPRTLQLPLGQFVQNALARNDSTAFPEAVLSPKSLAALSRHIEEYVLRSERLRVSLRQPWEDPMPVGGKQLWEHRPWHMTPSPIAAALAFTPGCVRIVVGTVHGPGRLSATLA